MISLKNNSIRTTKIVFAILTMVFGSSYAQEGKVGANGITIAYESFGKKTDEAIILIQGTGAPMTDWPSEFCQSLADNGFRVIRFDNRDIGLSTHLDSFGQPNWEAIGPMVGTCETKPLPYTINDMAEDVIGLMDALKIKRAHIAGASMGGAIAQLVAIHHPKRTLTLTSISATSGNPELPWGDPKALQAMGTPPPKTENKDSIADHLITIYKALGSTDNDAELKKQALEHLNRSWYPEGAARQGAAILIGDRCDRREQLAKLSMPTMVIHGDKDPIVPFEAGKDVTKTVPNSELCQINGMGHHFSMGFLKELEKCMVKNIRKVDL